MSGNQEILHEARGIVVIIGSIWFETCNISKILTHTLKVIARYVVTVNHDNDGPLRLQTTEGSNSHL